MQPTSRTPRRFGAPNPHVAAIKPEYQQSFSPVINDDKPPLPKTPSETIKPKTPSTSKFLSKFKLNDDTTEKDIESNDTFLKPSNEPTTVFVPKFSHPHRRPSIGHNQHPYDNNNNSNTNKLSYSQLFPSPLADGTSENGVSPPKSVPRPRAPGRGTAKSILQKFTMNIDSLDPSSLLTTNGTFPHNNLPSPLPIPPPSNNNNLPPTPPPVPPEIPLPVPPSPSTFTLGGSGIRSRLTNVHDQKKIDDEARQTRSKVRGVRPSSQNNRRPPTSIKSGGGSRGNTCTRICSMLKFW